jgi:hypothetical protein
LSVLWVAYATHSQFPDINKLCNVTSCCIYIGILLEAHHILHISRIRVKWISKRNKQGKRNVRISIIWVSHTQNSSLCSCKSVRSKLCVCVCVCVCVCLQNGLK